MVIIVNVRGGHWPFDVVYCSWHLELRSPDFGHLLNFFDVPMSCCFFLWSSVFRRPRQLLSRESIHMLPLHFCFQAWINGHGQKNHLFYLLHISHESQRIGWQYFTFTTLQTQNDDLTELYSVAILVIIPFLAAWRDWDSFSEVAIRPSMKSKSHYPSSGIYCRNST